MKARTVLRLARALPAAAEREPSIPLTPRLTLSVKVPSLKTAAAERTTVLLARWMADSGRRCCWRWRLMAVMAVCWMSAAGMAQGALSSCCRRRHTAVFSLSRGRRRARRFCQGASTSMSRCMKVSGIPAFCWMRTTESVGRWRSSSFSCLPTRLPPTWMRRSGRNCSLNSGQLSSRAVRWAFAWLETSAGSTNSLFSSSSLSRMSAFLSHCPTMTTGRVASLILLTRAAGGAPSSVS